MIHFVHFDVQHNSYIWCENCLSVYWKYINLNDILVLSLQIIAYERLRKRMNVFLINILSCFFVQEILHKLKYLLKFST